MKEWYTSYMKDEAEVIIPPNLENPPESHEIEAAWIIARHFNCVVKFLKPIIGYKIKTADFVFMGELWELEQPSSNSRRRCVGKQLERASKQSHNIIFDARKTKLEDDFLISQLSVELVKRSSVRKLLFISKSSNVIAIR